MVDKLWYEMSKEIKDVWKEREGQMNCWIMIDGEFIAILFGVGMDKQ